MQGPNETLCGLFRQPCCTHCLFFGQVEQKGSAYLRHAETPKDNLSTPCAYRCLKRLPSHFNAKPPPKPPDILNRQIWHIDARASAIPLGRGRIAQGMNRTDAIDCASLAVMTCLVSRFVGKWMPLHLLETSSLRSFSKIRCSGYFRILKINMVLFLIWLTISHITLSEKRVPACWVEAKVLSLFSKNLQAWFQQLPRVGCEWDFV